MPLETVSKLKSIPSSSITDIDFQELRNSLPISSSVIKGTHDLITLFKSNEKFQAVNSYLDILVASDLMTYTAKIKVRETKRIPRSEIFSFVLTEEDVAFFDSAILTDL